MAESNNPNGRPPISLNQLWNGWYNDVLNLYREGGSDVEVRAMIYDKTNGKIKCSYDLWQRWLNEEPEFSETIKMGKQFSEAWWNKMGRINLEADKFSYTGWYMNMKNRFGWTDRQQIEQHQTNIDLSNLSTEEIKDLLKDE